MDYAMQLFSFFIAPLFGTVILGMLWKRATNQGGFWGLLAGTVTSIGLWVWVVKNPSALRYVALSPDAKEMAENLYRALWAWLVCVGVTVLVSLVTKPRSVHELEGLVMGAATLPAKDKCHWYHEPIFWGGVVAVVFVVLNIALW
jgi:SSS family solute:Na+ symporter